MPMEQERVSPPPGQQVEEKTPWTVEETVKLLIASYRFSQGDASLQKDLFESIVREFPNRELLARESDSEILEKAKILTEKIILGTGSQHSKFTTGGEEITADIIGADLKDQLDVWRSVAHLNLKGLLGDYFIKRLLFSIIKRDRHFAVGAESQVQRGKSFLKHYVIDGNPTGTPEFNIIFSKLRQYLVQKNIILNVGLNNIAEQLSMIVG